MAAPALALPPTCPREPSAPGYKRRRPEETLLWQLQCSACHHEVHVAFSCKGRGFCPSCGARRMHTTAAHLVEEVLPDVPVRQWVLSAPFELRLLLARKPDLLTALDRIVVDEISRFYRVRANACGLAGSQTGAVTFVHRFGGSLNLHVHLHVVAVDGVFTRQPGERAVFHAVASPTPEQLSVVTDNVARRRIRWLARAGYLREADDGAEPELDGIARCFQLSLAGGTFLSLDADAA